MAKDKLKMYAMLQQELLNELKELESRAASIRKALKSGGLDGCAIPVPFVKERRSRGKKTMGGEIPVPFHKGRHTSTGRKVTMNDAILLVLGKSGQADIPTLFKGATEIKGKISKASLNQALVVLKKKSAILNPARGRYALKK